MSSITNGVRFMFGGETSDEHEVILCNTFNSTTRSPNIENRTLVTSKNLSGAFNFHGIRYDEPLVFDFIIAKEDATYIDIEKERELKKWLLKNKRQWLQIDQDGLDDIVYYCIITKAEILNVGAYSGGMLLTAECDSYYAYSNLVCKSYMVSGALNFDINLDLDFDELSLYPLFIITPSANGDITIANNSTNQTVKIKNCVPAETIILENSSDKIKSSANRLIIDSWNKETISLKDKLNTFTLTGNFKLELQYRLPIRVRG